MALASPPLWALAQATVSLSEATPEARTPIFFPQTGNHRNDTNAFSYTCYTPLEKGSAAPGRSPYNNLCFLIPLPESSQRQCLRTWVLDVLSGQWTPIRRRSNAFLPQHLCQQHEHQRAIGEQHSQPCGGGSTVGTRLSILLSNNGALIDIVAGGARSQSVGLLRSDACPWRKGDISSCRWNRSKVNGEYITTMCIAVQSAPLSSFMFILVLQPGTGAHLHFAGWAVSKHSEPRAPSAARKMSPGITDFGSESSKIKLTGKAKLHVANPS